MNLRKLFLLGVALIAAAAMAIGPEVTVRANAPAKAKAGKPLTIAVQIAIPEGYHIYGPGKVQTGVPTDVTVVVPKGFKVLKTSYPATKQYQALGETVPVFEGTATVKVSVLAPQGTHGKQNFTVKVSSQACNDRTCLMPSTIEAKVAVNFN